MDCSGRTSEGLDREKRYSVDGLAGAAFLEIVLTVWR